MDNFKSYYKIEKEITLPSKVENNRLFVFYKEKWCQLSKDPEIFYKRSTIQQYYKADFCKELGLSTNKGKKYSHDYYLKNKKAYNQAAKKYQEKKKAEKIQQK